MGFSYDVLDDDGNAMGEKNGPSSYEVCIQRLKEDSKSLSSTGQVTQAFCDDIKEDVASIKMTFYIVFVGIFICCAVLGIVAIFIHFKRWRTAKKIKRKKTGCCKYLKDHCMCCYKKKNGGLDTTTQIDN